MLVAYVSEAGSHHKLPQPSAQVSHVSPRRSALYEQLLWRGVLLLHCSRQLSSIPAWRCIAQNQGQFCTSAILNAVKCKCLGKGRVKSNCPRAREACLLWPWAVTKKCVGPRGRSAIWTAHRARDLGVFRRERDFDPTRAPCFGESPLAAGSHADTAAETSTSDSHSSDILSGEF